MTQTPPCRTCGASLAPDQRYCLSCGTRAAAPRLDFVAEAERTEAEDAAAAAGASATAAEMPVAAALPLATVAVATAGPPSRLDRIGGPMGAAAVVLVALGIGFLVGQASVREQPQQQRAPVVTVQSSAEAMP